MHAVGEPDDRRQISESAFTHATAVAQPTQSRPDLVDAGMVLRTGDHQQPQRAALVGRAVVELAHARRRGGGKGTEVGELAFVRRKSFAERIAEEFGRRGERRFDGGKRHLDAMAQGCEERPPLGGSLPMAGGHGEEHAEEQSVNRPA
jgi:hypothetical protein